MPLKWIIAPSNLPTHTTPPYDTGPSANLLTQWPATVGPSVTPFNQSPLDDGEGASDHLHVDEDRAEGVLAGLDKGGLHLRLQLRHVVHHVAHAPLGVQAVEHLIERRTS
jgi:hypothetical protein